MLKKLCNRETGLYLFFGVLTTVVNYGVFWLCRDWMHSLLANGLAFILATLFAYVTNKLFVFRSPQWTPGVVGKELLSFTGARTFSLCIEMLGLYLCILLHAKDYVLWGMDGEMIAKIVLSFVAVLLNYFMSKFWIFKKKEPKM